MKRLLFLLPLASLTAYGQFKIKTEVTPGGDTLYSTPDKKIYAAPGPRNAVGETVKSKVYKTANGYSLCLQIETGRTSVFTVGTSDAATVSLADGTSLDVYSKSDNASHRSSVDYGCWIFVFYRLSGEAVRKLEAQNVAKIEVVASLGKMTYEIKSGQADIIRKQVQSFEAVGKEE